MVNTNGTQGDNAEDLSRLSALTAALGLDDSDDDDSSKAPPSTSEEETIAEETSSHTSESPKSPKSQEQGDNTGNARRQPDLNEIQQAVGKALQMELSKQVSETVQKKLPPVLADALGESLRLIVKELLPSAIAPTRCIAARAWNAQVGDGSERPYELLPFGDGKMPNEDPYSLPPLYNASDVAGLSPEHLVQYLKGYLPGKPLPEDEQQRVTLLHQHIGSSSGS